MIGIDSENENQDERKIAHGEILLLKSNIVSFARAVVKSDLLLEGRPKGVMSNAVVFSIRLEKRRVPGSRTRDDFYHMVFYACSNYVYVFAGLNQSFMLSPSDKLELQSHHDSCWSSDGLVGLWELLMTGRYVGIFGMDVSIVKIREFSASGEYDRIYSFDGHKKTITEVAAE